MFIPSTIGRSPVIAAPTPIPWAARREAPVTRQGTWDARHEAVLANGCVKQTELAILLVQVVRDLVAAAVVPHVLTHHHNLQVAKKRARSQRTSYPPSGAPHRRIALQFLVSGLAQRLPHQHGLGCFVALARRA